MGIALLTLADLFMPLQSLARRWLPAGRAHRRTSSNLRYVAIRPACAARSAGKQPEVARPLRVVHVVDGEQSARGAGRVVISGRMADVCAELDRLAALEASGHASTAKSLH